MSWQRFQEEYRPPTVRRKLASSAPTPTIDVAALLRCRACFAERHGTQAEMPQWTDKPIVAGSTRIRAVHITELRTAVANARVAAGLPRFTWPDPVINTTVPTKAVHFTA